MLVLNILEEIIMILIFFKVAIDELVRDILSQKHVNITIYFVGERKRDSSFDYDELCVKKEIDQYLYNVDTQYYLNKYHAVLKEGLLSCLEPIVEPLNISIIYTNEYL